MSTPSKSDLLQQSSEEDEDEGKRSGEAAGARRKFNEFECPICTAYNPQEEFGNGEEVRCSYCGLGFLALVDTEGKLKLREE